jgi:hypothetical protein
MKADLKSRSTANAADSASFFTMVTSQHESGSNRNKRDIPGF